MREQHHRAAVLAVLLAAACGSGGGGASSGNGNTADALLGSVQLLSHAPADQPVQVASF